MHSMAAVERIVHATARWKFTPPSNTAGIRFGAGVRVGVGWG